MKHSLNFSSVKSQMIILFLGLIFIIGCNDDDMPSTSNCTGVALVGGSMDLNNEDLELTSALLFAFPNNPTAGTDQYSFDIRGISSDCSIIREVTINFLIDAGSNLDGTYEITDTFENNTVTSDITYRPTDLSALTFLDIVSGNITVADNGSDSYEITISGTDENGDAVEFNVDKQF